MPKPQKLLRISRQAQDSLSDLAHILRREQGELAEEAIMRLRQHYAADPKVQAALEALEAARQK